jgi:AcrR family transcriptional regulator
MEMEHIEDVDFDSEEQEDIETEPADITRIGVEPSGLRERKKARLRRQIVDTAVRLFRERGYNNTRVADITEALEISQGTFFRYFPSKNAVLREVRREVLRRFYQALEEGSAGGSFEAGLKRAYGQLAHFITADPTLSRAVMMTGSGLPWTSPDAEDRQVIRGASPLEDALKKAQSTGELALSPSAVQLSQILWGMMSVVIAQWSLTRDYDIREHMFAAIDVFLNGSKKRG